MENLTTPVTTNSTIPAERNNFSIIRVAVGVLLIVIALIIGFFAGSWYNAQPPGAVTSEITDTSSNEQGVVSEEVATKVSIPSNSLYVSAETGIFKGHLTRKEFPPSMSSMPETCDVFVITEGDLSMFYEAQPDGKWLPIAQSRLPFDLVIDTERLSVMTQEALKKSSASAPIVAAVTDYVSTAGKDSPGCSQYVDDFRAL